MRATSIPLVNLRRQHDLLSDELTTAIRRVIDESAFIGGHEVAEFEREFSQYCGTRYCVGVANGTDALVLALMTLGIGAGDEVVTTATSFFATSEAISRAGATPVFCDIDPETANLNVGLLERLIGPKTRAIIPVHLYGQPAAMDWIIVVARQHGLYVIEDCAQAAGARYNNKRVGNVGDLGCFSFYPSKNLGALGDGGAIVTDDKDWAVKCRALANHGGTKKYEHEVEGFNSRLDSLQAAILRIKLRYLDKWNEQRRTIADRYRDLLANKNIEHLQCIEQGWHVYHLFVIRLIERDQVLRAMKSAGIGAEVHYPAALPFLAPYRDRGYSSQDYPVASRHASMALSLPIFPLMTSEEVQQVADTLLASFGRLK